MYAILSLVLLIVVLGIGATFGYAIVEPIVKADRRARTQFRFYTCDFFALSFLLTIPILFFTSIRRLFGADVIIVNGIGFILIGVFAAACVREATSLSGIGVVDSRKRFAYLAVLLPIAILGSAIIVPTLIMMTFSLSQMTIFNLSLWLAAVVVVPVVAILCRKCTLWVISPAGRSTDVPASCGPTVNDQETQHTA